VTRFVHTVALFACLGCTTANRAPGLAEPSPSLDAARSDAARFDAAPSPHARQPGAEAQAKLRVADDGKLYVVGLGAIMARGVFIYVLSADPIPGTTTHPPLGLVKVLAPPKATHGAHAVAWYCEPEPARDGGSLNGLPAELIHPDIETRVGKCWGRYKPKPETWTKLRSEVRINLGQGDGVRPGDLFDLLGDANVDDQGRVVTELGQVARCVVLSQQQGSLYSDCEIDLSGWPAYSRETFLAGGFVHRVRP
jgi:hypothetical protein